MRSHTCSFRRSFSKWRRPVLVWWWRNRYCCHLLIYLQAVFLACHFCRWRTSMLVGRWWNWYSCYFFSWLQAFFLACWVWKWYLRVVIREIAGSSICTCVISLNFTANALFRFISSIARLFVTTLKMYVYCIDYKSYPSHLNNGCKNHVHSRYSVMVCWTLHEVCSSKICKLVDYVIGLLYDLIWLPSHPVPFCS